VTSPAAPPARPSHLDDIVEPIDHAITRAVRGATLPEHLQDAVLYAATGGGKRLRPAMLVMSCEAAGGRRQRAMGPAVAIELVHCFSLVHDDLPGMDDDALRRGRPTLHVHTSEAMAILAGDAMLCLAFQVLATDPELAAHPGLVVRILQELTTATTAMIGGQVYDTLGGLPAAMSDQERLSAIHRYKTGALFRAACRMGGLAAKADAATVRALTQYGEAAGLMFQVVDDVLDVTQSTEHLGKATGKDERAGKLTFPGLLGLTRSREEIGRLQETARAALAPLGTAAEPLRQLCDFMAVRTR
jgi:geranylgeranyl pyrophosphate synthase